MNYGAKHPERCSTLMEKFAFSMKYMRELQQRPDEMQDDIIKRLFDAAELASMDAEQRRKIDILAGLHNSRPEGYEEGLEEGIAKGREAERLWTAEVLRKKGLSEELIAEVISDGDRS